MTRTAPALVSCPRSSSSLRPGLAREGAVRTLAGLLLCTLAAGAYGHGGNYQPPPPPPDKADPPPPPPPPAPQTPETPPGKSGPSVGDDIDPPSTGGDPKGGPSTGGRPATPVPPPGPSTGGGPGGGGPATGGPATGSSSGRGRGAALSRDHWSRWWYANRTFVIDLHARAAGRRVVTPGGKASARTELWREEAQVALLRALDHEGEDLVTGAAIALGKGGDAEAIKPLRTVLDDHRRSTPVREAAALGLGLVGVEADPASRRATRALLERVAADPRERERLRAMAVYAIGLRGETRSVPFLLEVARAGASTWDVPAAGASALGLTRDAPRDDLLALLSGTRVGRARSGKATVGTHARVYAAHGLARAGDRSALPTLRAALDDDDRNVRRAAVLALGALANPADRKTALALQSVVHSDPDRPTRNMAALSIGRVGDPTAERTLRYRYKKGDGQHQPYAALGLGLLAQQTEDRAIAKLLAREFERRANADLRGALAIALGLSGDPAHAPVLRAVVKDRGNHNVRAHAAVGLGLMGDTHAAPLLRELLGRNGDPVLVREVALALGLLRDRESVKVLAELVVEKDSVYVQGSAAVALGRIGGGESAEVLIALLEDDSRPYIARAMGAIGLGLLLDRTEGRSLDRLGADLNWYVLTPAIEEILTIL